MKAQLQQIFSSAIEQLKGAGIIPKDHEVIAQFERTRQKEHGDFATNIAMTLAKAARKNPRELAELIVDALPNDPLVSKAEIAGPGFINLFLAQGSRYEVLKHIFKQREHFGIAEENSKDKVLVEFVSANPTGPLHVGHGRGAAYGDALARVLTAAGHSVESEYYVNDAGRQMDILAVSVWVRYLQALGEAVELPDNAYKGVYVTKMGQDLAHSESEKFRLTAEQFNSAREGLDDEAALDASIAQAKKQLGIHGFSVFFDLALDCILSDIKEDLQEFGVDYHTWFSERSLFDSGKIESAISLLKESGDVYEKGGAWWFKGTAYGDEKDRVVIRENGQPTYFASDIAYHRDKLQRGFDLSINVWGSDHHGYIPRVKAALQALGLDPQKLKVLLVQFAVLYRSGEKMSMSTRSGEFVTLRDLRNEIGSDAARFFYAMRKSEQHMDFDLDLAKEQSNENPMYYVQYAHARICRLFDTAQERGIDLSGLESADFSQLVSEHENKLLTVLARLPETINKAASDYEPHQISYYLRDVATAFHSYYNTSKFLEAEANQRKAMLALCSATRQVLKNGLTVLGVSAPLTM